MKEDPIYKQHRIHTTRLPSGLWLGKIVTFGKKQAITKHSLTAAVTRVPGSTRPRPRPYSRPSSSLTRR